MKWRSEEDLFNSFYWWLQPGKYSFHQLSHLELVDGIFREVELESVPQVDHLHLSKDIGLAIWSLEWHLRMKDHSNLFRFIFFCLRFGHFLLYWSLGVVLILQGFDGNRIDEIFQVVWNVIFTFGCLFPPFPGFFQLWKMKWGSLCLFWPTWYTVFILLYPYKRSTLAIVSVRSLL